MARLVSSCRVQLNREFTLRDARSIVPYLDRLGITHLYCSPILAARAGSPHGYDVVDPACLNPELGTEDDLRALAEDLRAREMGILLDIVPNHMTIGEGNPYWEDVLAHGERSRFARWFDVDWPAAEGRVVLPVLGADPDEVIARGELTLELDPDAPRLRYQEQSFPIDPATLPDDPRATLRALLDAQHYRLVCWKSAEDAINYRRFFDLNHLVALRQEDPEVFAATHARVLAWAREGLLDGLRIDHVDGLLDPKGYLERLRGCLPAAFPILVEKILSPGERLRDDWPVQGTTGYEFLNDLEDVFIDAGGYGEIERRYRHMRRLEGACYGDVARDAKLWILDSSLRPELVRLARMLHPIAGAAGMSWPLPRIADGIAQFIAALPVYRTYAVGEEGDPHADDVDAVERALLDLRSRAVPDHARELAGFVGDLVLGRRGGDGSDEDARLHFVRRLQQTSGPATAKGVEDTALYVYVPLASRNEVGGAPDRPLVDAVERLHTANAERRARWPSALIATNTHDTKRSADVRARLDVLSEIPGEWKRHLLRWRRLNRKHHATVRGRVAPDTNSEYLFYQTLVGIFPAPRPGRRADDLPDRGWCAEARERLIAYMLKAVREAKTRTTWRHPDARYEEALRKFVVAVIEPDEEAPFLPDVARLVARIAPAAHWNSLSRILLHFTSPGVADLYQGDELWNQTLVDPDNRRPVEWERRKELAESLGGEELALEPGSDQAKLALTARLLRARRASPALFLDGDYRVLTVCGDRAAHVVAFARSAGAQSMVVVAPRLLASLEEGGGGAGERTLGAAWGTMKIVLPAELSRRSWRSALDGRTLPAGGGMGDDLPVADLFRSHPLALLLSP